MHKIKKLKFGLKLWSTNSDLIKEAEDLIKKGIFDYIELMVVPDTQISLFQAAKVPYIIHITSERWGVNIADRDKEAFNKQIISQNIEWADKLKAGYLILHPGFGPISNAAEFLRKISDKRVLIENMPKLGIGGGEVLGHTPEQIKTLTGSKFGFCLDFNHAIKAAISLRKNYKKFIKEFLELKPKMVHISDGTLKNEKDEHLNIGEGKYDFKFLAECIKNRNTYYLTLETPRVNYCSLKEDLENIIKLKEFLSF